MRAYPPDISVRIADCVALESLLLTEAPGLTQAQLASAGSVAVIDGMQIDRCGNPSYSLTDIPGMWPHSCLTPWGRPVKVDFMRNRSEPELRTAGGTVSAPGLPSDRLFVGGVPWRMSDTGLLRLFLNAGGVKTANVVRFSDTGRSKGFAWVTMGSISEAAHAKAEVDGKVVLENGEYVTAYTSAELSDQAQEPHADQLTVVEIIESVSQRLAAVICREPGRLQELEWRDVERMLAVVLDALGYVVHLTRPAKDDGKDIVVKFVAAREAQSYYVEVKHWVSGKRVGREPVREFLSVVVRDHQHGGILISTSGFSPSAAQGLTEIERLRFGDSNAVVSLCRTYLGVSGGLLRPVDHADIIRRVTCPATEFDVSGL